MAMALRRQLWQTLIVPTALMMLLAAIVGFRHQAAPYRVGAMSFDERSALLWLTIEAIVLQAPGGASVKLFGPRGTS